MSCNPDRKVQKNISTKEIQRPAKLYDTTNGQDIPGKNSSPLFSTSCQSQAFLVAVVTLVLPTAGYALLEPPSAAGTE